MKIFVALCLSVLMTSCMTIGNYQQVTSGQVGCPPGDIKIADVSDAVLAGMTATWKAECDNKTYYCSMQTAHQGGSQTSCKEREKD